MAMTDERLAELEMSATLSSGSTIEIRPYELLDLISELRAAREATEIAWREAHIIHWAPGDARRKEDCNTTVCRRIRAALAGKGGE